MIYVLSFLENDTSNLLNDQYYPNLMTLCNKAFQQMKPSCPVPVPHALEIFRRGKYAVHVIKPYQKNTLKEDTITSNYLALADYKTLKLKRSIQRSTTQTSVATGFDVPDSKHKHFKIIKP